MLEILFPFDKEEGGLFWLGSFVQTKLLVTTKRQLIQKGEATKLMSNEMIFQKERVKNRSSGVIGTSPS